jgi:hypothetical protein
MFLKNYLFKSVVLFTVFIGTISAYSQEVTPGADLVSRYIWRGKDFGSSPAFQPALTFSAGDFAIGAWGSVTFNDNKFQEQDLFMSYKFYDMVSLIVTDYFFPSDIIPNNNYFEYNDSLTGHTLEATVKFEGTEDIPFTLAVNYNFWGWDKDNSAYIELAYFTKIKDNKFDVFLGATTGEGIYGNTAGVVYFGATAKKEIKITESYSLPVFCRFITNPQAENIHLVFGLSL